MIYDLFIGCLSLKKCSRILKNQPTSRQKHDMPPTALGVKSPPPPILGGLRAEGKAQVIHLIKRPDWNQECHMAPSPHIIYFLCKTCMIPSDNFQAKESLKQVPKSCQHKDASCLLPKLFQGQPKTVPGPLPEGPLGHLAKDTLAPPGGHQESGNLPPTPTERQPFWKQWHLNHWQRFKREGAGEGMAQEGHLRPNKARWEASDFCPANQRQQKTKTGTEE